MPGDDSFPADGPFSADGSPSADGSSLADGSPLLAFYAGGARDAQGRTHSEILAWSDATLEAVHDYIQWLFPLPEPSGANPRAPLMTPRVRQAFQTSPAMRHRLRAAWLRMLRFYGLAVDADGTVAPAANFDSRAKHWLTPYNHNHLRLTRILRSLHRAGLERESASLYAALAAIYEQDQRAGRTRVTPETFRYWQHARD
jgi:hypothetical protein